MGRYIKELFLFGCGGFMMLCIMELFLAYSEVSPQIYRIPEEGVGLTYRGNADVLRLNEGFYIGNTNQYNYFDLSKEKKENEIRIAFIGDSYLAGEEVFYRNHFCSLIEKELNSAFNSREVTVINLGMKGHDLCDAYSRYKFLEPQLQPDYLILFTGYDDLNCVDAPGDPKIIYKDRALTITPPDLSVFRANSSSILKVLKRTRVWKMLSNCRRMVNLGKTPEIVLGKFARLFTADKDLKPIKEEKSKKEPTIVIDSRIKQILNDLPEETIFVYRDIPQNELIDLLNSVPSVKKRFLDSDLKKLKDKGIHPRYWKATKEYGHFNLHAHQVISQSLSSELIEMIGLDN